MRKFVLRKLLPGLVLMCGLLCAGLTSCVSDDGDWWGGPPAGWNTFNDTRLEG